MNNHSDVSPIIQRETDVSTPDAFILHCYLALPARQQLVKQFYMHALSLCCCIFESYLILKIDKIF